MSKFATPDTTRSQKIGAVISLPDRQSTSLANSAVTDEHFATLFQQAFEGQPILQDQAKIQAVSALANTLKHEQKKQLDTVIQIGRAFRRTEDVFSQSEWKQLLTKTQELFGMSKQTASMYRNVAADIDSGRIPRDLCPPSFSTAYQLTTLNEKQLEKAKKTGLISPDVTREAVIAFKKRNKPIKTKREPSGKIIQRQIESLKKKRESLYKQLEAVEKNIAELESCEGMGWDT